MVDSESLFIILLFPKETCINYPKECGVAGSDTVKTTQLYAKVIEKEVSEYFGPYCTTQFGAMCTIDFGAKCTTF
jgi:hypothetical protein